MAPPVNRRVLARAPRGWSILLVALLVVPLLEIAVIIGVGKVIGGWPTLLLLLAESALGAWLVKREGARSWRALSTALSTGRMPSRELADAALVLVGGTLLLTPGFLTDVLGFAFVLPVTRPVARRALEAVVTRKLLGGAFGAMVGEHGPAERGRGGQGRGGQGRGGQGPGERSRPGPPAADEVIEGEVL